MFRFLARLVVLVYCVNSIVFNYFERSCASTSETEKNISDSFLFTTDKTLDSFGALFSGFLFLLCSSIQENKHFILPRKVLAAQPF